MPASDSSTSISRIDSPAIGGVTTGWVPKARARVGAAASAVSGQAVSSLDDLSRIDVAHNQEPSEVQPYDREVWLRLHATELIRRLQTWASGLDAREASLNAAYARQDLRERQFRLQQTDFQAEMDEAQRATNELHAQMVAQSRQLAFQSFA